MPKTLHQEIDKAEKALHKDLYKLQEKHAGILIKQKKEFEEICKKLKTLEQTVDSLENSKDVRGLMELKFELENQQIPTFIEETRPAFFQPIKFNESYTSSFGYIQELESQKLPFDDLTKEDQISSSGQVLSISEVLSTFNTEFPAKKENNNRLFDMIPLGDDKVWAGGANHELKLFDLQGCLHDTVAISDYGGYLTLHDGHVVYTDKKENNNRLFDMIPLGDDKVWAGGASHELKLFDLQGCLHDTVDISDYGGYLTLHDGHVVYTDRNDNTVKKVINGKVDTLFRTGEYNPSGITCTAAGDFLVCLQTTESKIVRYSTSGDVLEEIQYDSQYQPLFKDAVYVVENGNGDVCVADWGKKAVTVVNKFGIFRFSYTGNKASKEEFLPSSLTTDSMHYITITDIINDKIHMLDRDGRFLGYIIPDQGIQRPRAVCVIREGEIMVGECLTGMIKRIKYLQ
ncbi:uncharacterized protein LOC134279943 [Saccostrea cucullata]|uniref:uncharacterized protein LOC134279943 n=1 Tax=Saccostrea cuccullata TaxID=36930 RepID=UPI002ED59E2A